MNAKSKWLEEDGNIVAPNTLDSCVFGSDGKSLEEKLPFRFGIDENGNYGYIKNGETDVTPFGTETGSIISSNDVNYVFMSFKENIVDIVSTSSGTDPIPFENIETNGLTVENYKVKLVEGRKYFISASVQNPTAHYINICNKDGIFVMNGSDGGYQATTQSCIYTAQKDDVIYLGVSNNSGGAGSVRKNSTFTVIELFGSSSGSSSLGNAETIWSGLTELDTNWHDLTLAKSIDSYDYLIISYWNLASSGGCEHAGYMLIPKIDFYLSSTYPGEEDYTFFCGDNVSSQATGITFRIKDKNTLTYKNATNVSGFKTVIRAIYGIKSTSSTGTSSNMHNYSTEEKVVGTWIDGRNMYERTIYGTTSGNNGTWIDIGITIPDVDVFMTSEKGIKNPIEWDMFDDRINALVAPSTGAVKVKQNISSSNVEYTFYLVLHYVKTTDTATV